MYDLHNLTNKPTILESIEEATRYLEPIMDEIEKLKTRISILEQLLKEAYPAVRACAQYMLDDDLIVRARSVINLSERIAKTVDISPRQHPH